MLTPDAKWAVRWISLLPLAAVAAVLAGSVIRGPLFFLAVRVSDALDAGGLAALWAARYALGGAATGAAFVAVASVVAPFGRRTVATAAFVGAAAWAARLAVATMASTAGGTVQTSAALLPAVACVAGAAVVWGAVRGHGGGRRPAHVGA